MKLRHCEWCKKVVEFDLKIVTPPIQFERHEKKGFKRLKTFRADICHKCFKKIIGIERYKRIMAATEWRKNINVYGRRQSE